MDRREIEEKTQAWLMDLLNRSPQRSRQQIPALTREQEQEIERQTRVRGLAIS